jgi:hypothetical protein
MEQNPTDLKELFDAWADHEKYPFLRREEYLQVFHLCPTLAQPDKLVLDVGCGIDP